MVGILVISHGRLAQALVSSARFLMGSLQRAKGICVWPRQREKDVRDRIRREIRELDEGDGVVILTDILGGTPTNVTLPFIQKEKVEVLTGVNMPMLLTLASYRKAKPLRELVSLVKKSGRRSIVSAKGLMRASKNPLEIRLNG